MRSSSTAASLMLVFAAFVLMLVVVGTPGSRRAPTAPATHSPAPGPRGVSGQGLTLTSVDVTLPEEDATYPDGPDADVINANCTSCHSASMALYQPRLSAEEWRKEVEKMRDTFKAPVAEADVPAIVAYLTAMSARLPADS